MATIQPYETKQGRMWRAQIRKNHASQSKSFRTKREAEAWAKHTEQHLKDDPEPLSQPSYTLKDLMIYYRQNHVSENTRTRKSQNSLLKFWETRLGHYQLTDLNPILINKYRRVLSNDVRNYKPGTILQYLIRLRAVLNVAVKELHWLEHSPMANMKLPKDSRPRDRYLTIDEIQRLLRICKQERQHPQIYPMVFLTINTGLRLSEVTNILLQHLDTANRSILLPTTKNDDPHIIYLTEEVLEVLSEHIKQTLIAKPFNWRDVSLIHDKLYCTDREYLFPSLERADKPIYVRNAWKKVRKLARLNDGKVVYHTLRHTVASLLARQGKTLNDIAHVLNHKDLRSTRRYVHLLEEHKRENFAAITEAIAGRRP